MPFHMFLDVAPPRPLHPYVRSLRAVRIHADDSWADAPTSPRPCRVPPDGSGHLLVRVCDGGPTESSRRPLPPDRILLDVVGPRTIYTDLELSADTLMIAVRLQPAAINSLFGQPSAEWVDQRLPLADALRADVDRLRTQLADAPTLADRLSVLQDALLRWYASSPSLPPAMLAAIQHVETPPSSASPTVREVADRVGVSTRHLRTLFRKHVGLSPKMFARVKRLHRAVHAFRKHPSAPWSRLALETGFYDQSHLVADFRSLLGTTPSAFRARDLQLQQ